MYLEQIRGGSRAKTSNLVKIGGELPTNLFLKHL